ncbi:MAG: iron reductase [Hyphomicrobiales bacterium]|nr:ferric reductase-like transmembrane domain-containing protein [Hyphomicrobiales bacterium]PCJ95149.1 MAG: iron reductase [Hyphomicrobiales bacterium]
MVSRFLNARWFIWGLLFIPAIPMLADVIGAQFSEPVGRSIYHRLLHPSGEFAARFMIIAMMMTPLRMLFPKNRFLAWMMRRRRYFGVAAFGYAAAHTVFYILDVGTLDKILAELWETGIWTGWLAFAIFVPLAITSNDYCVRKLGRAWKIVQRWVYAAAVLSLVHWIFIDRELEDALVNFLPLAGLEAYRIYRVRRRTITA